MVIQKFDSVPENKLIYNKLKDISKISSIISGRVVRDSEGGCWLSPFEKQREK